MDQVVTIDNIFQKAEAFSPYLKGEPFSLSNTDDELLIMGEDCSHQIRTLYDSLAQLNPEAGNGYYLTRTWDLLCWQPIYLAFVSIYQLGSAPKIQSIAQKFQSYSIYGFHFMDDTVHQQTVLGLIESVALDLVGLFEDYRKQMSDWIRIRPGFTNALIADMILKLITTFQPITPTISHLEWVQHANSWLDFCQLPTKFANQLKYSSSNNELTYVRTSCCQVYKCAERSLCDDCPRVISNRH